MELDEFTVPRKQLALMIVDHELQRRFLGIRCEKREKRARRRNEGGHGQYREGYSAHRAVHLLRNSDADHDEQLPVRQGPVHSRPLATPGQLSGFPAAASSPR